MPALVEGTFETDDDELESIWCMCPDVVCNLGNIGIIQSGIDFIENKERSWLVTNKKRSQFTMNFNDTVFPDLWMANKSAKAATVFSPPDNCSISRKRFIGGMAWYLIPPLYGSW